MQVGYSHEVEKGKAYIRMYTDNSYQDYQIEIDHISYGGQKNLTFTVKSPELLAMTNGIVQGMSGSPILQNGKFVGAVTHVFIDNPTKGYGIFAETMLKRKIKTVLSKNVEKRENIGLPIFVAEDIISFCKGNEKNLMEGNEWKP